LLLARLLAGAVAAVVQIYPRLIFRRWLADGVIARLSWHLFHADLVGIVVPSVS
jgi:hypothetical protein